MYQKCLYHCSSSLFSFFFHLFIFYLTMCDVSFFFSSSVFNNPFFLTSILTKYRYVGLIFVFFILFSYAYCLFFLFPLFFFSFLPTILFPLSSFNLPVPSPAHRLRSSLTITSGLSFFSSHFLVIHY